MSLLTKLEVLYNLDGVEVNLLINKHECKHRFELIDSQALTRLCDGELSSHQKKCFKRRLIIEGVSFPPDIWQLSANTVLKVVTGARFVSSFGSVPNYADQNTVLRKQYAAYRIVMNMMTQNFISEYDELEGVSSWKWYLEEV